MTTGIPDSLERLTQADLIGVVRDLIGEVGRLRAENEKLSGALTKLKTEHQAIRDELARLKNLPPRPPQKPSGMDKATDRGGSSFDQRSGGDGKSAKGEKSRRRRGSQLDKLTIDTTVVVRAKAPAGSRHEGYEEIVVQDLNLSPQVTLYRRERWETPEGETIIAALDPGIVGGYGPNLHRLILALHFSGQVTCERIVALLNGMGVKISKRQVVRLLTAKLEKPSSKRQTGGRPMAKVTVELPSDEARALAQLVKRLGYHDAERLSSRYDGGEERDAMLSSINKLRQALAEAGF